MNNVLSLNIADLSTTSRSSALSPVPPNIPSPLSASAGLTTTAQPQDPFGTHKEVGFELLERAQARHRKHGEVPYPLRTSNQFLNFDVIDHFSLVDLCGGLTFQKLETPPKRVLDLGCGTGAWIIAAAHAWPDATFVGFDIHARQSDLSLLPNTTLQKRIEWVHGNFLEILPLSDAEFDFVRTQNIGLGVPEDEWQNVMDEIVRVMKPGGSLEVVEEDIVFPCPDTPVTKTPRASPTLRGRVKRSQSRSTRNTAYSEEERGQQSDRDRERENEPSVDRYVESEKSRSLETISTGQQDQRDHTKLKEAFMSMLNSRFINPQVLTVLPFYLQAAFQEVQQLPIMRLYLPLPSGVVHQSSHNSNGQQHATKDNSDDCSSSQLSLDSSSSSTLVDHASTSTSASAYSSSSPMAIRRFFDPYASINISPEQEFLKTRMHLVRTIEMVRCCKEAIWQEYERIHSSEIKNPNNRLDRDDFEALFLNWECDMQDRCSMRDIIQRGLGWPIPSNLPKPTWSDWREKGDTEDVATFYASAPLELLRALRGFVCRKPVHIIRTELVQ